MNESEIARRQRKYKQIVDAQAHDAERVAEIATLDADRSERADELRPVLQALIDGGTASEFRTEVDKWSRRPGYSGFNRLWAMEGSSSGMTTVATLRP